MERESDASYVTHRKAGVHIESEDLKAAEDAENATIQRPQTNSLRKEEQALWDLFDTGSVTFDAGEDPDVVSRQQHRELG